MTHTEKTFTGIRNTELFYHAWTSQKQAPGNIIFIHGGSGDHSSRNMNIINNLISQGYNVFAFDLRGCGRSKGKMGFIKSWNDYREDLRLFINMVKEQYSQIPLFLLGHSVGGVIVLDFILRSPMGIKGVICSSPAIGEIKISPLLWIPGILFNIICPWFPIKSGIDLNKISRDKKIIEDSINDPLYHGKGTPRFGIELIKTVEWIHANAKNLQTPLLAIHGTADGVIDIQGTRQLKTEVNFKDTTFIEYEGAYHELYNDIIKEEVFADVNKWIIDHLK